MSTPTEILSPEMIAEASRLVKEHDLEHEAAKKNLLIEDRAIFSAERDLPRLPDWSTDLSRGARVTFPKGLRVFRGDLLEAKKYDRIPQGDAFRRLTVEEVAPDTVTLQDAQRLREVERPARTAAELVQAVQDKILSAEQEAAAVQRKIADLAESLAIAQDRQRAAEATEESHLAGRTPEWRARAKALAASFPERCKPAPPSDAPAIVTINDLRRTQSGDTSASGFRSGSDGPIPLERSRGL